jgi:hypothetical protein
MTEEPEAGLREVWEAVRARCAGDRAETQLACAKRLAGRRGETWIKARWAVFEALRLHGVSEIVSGRLSLPDSEHIRNAYAAEEVRRWLRGYKAHWHDDEQLRRLLTWHLRWEEANRGRFASPVPLADPHLGALLRARNRVLDDLRVQEPLRIAQDFFGQIGRPPTDPRFVERAGPDSLLDQLRLHTPDHPVWQELPTIATEIERYETATTRFTQAVEGAVIERAQAERGYGPGRSFGPGEQLTLAEAFTFHLLDYAFALVAGEAPTRWRLQITPESADSDHFRLKAGWRQLTDVAIGDYGAVQRAKSIHQKITAEVIRSSDLRAVWSLRQTASEHLGQLATELNTLDLARIRSGHCWGCPATAGSS